MTKPWLSIFGIATHLGVNADSIYTQIVEKHLVIHRIDRLRKFEAAESNLRSPG